ncbi:hypothetical protein FHG87_004281 [Trinorchestia longiramus]|nr:hypothetical protein FHG87_004281 [Trinorchestia longiramus]
MSWSPVIKCPEPPKNLLCQASTHQQCGVHQAGVRNSAAPGYSRDSTTAPSPAAGTELCSLPCVLPSYYLQTPTPENLVFH